MSKEIWKQSVVVSYNLVVQQFAHNEIAMMYFTITSWTCVEQFQSDKQRYRRKDMYICEVESW